VLVHHVWELVKHRLHVGLPLARRLVLLLRLRLLILLLFRVRHVTASGRNIDEQHSACS
jgi:hypothetical protein